MQWINTAREQQEMLDAVAKGRPHDRSAQAAAKAYPSQVRGLAIMARHCNAPDGTRWDCCPLEGGMFQMFKNLRPYVVNGRPVVGERDVLIHSVDTEAVIE